jgi:hypothetical protein
MDIPAGAYPSPSAFLEYRSWFADAPPPVFRALAVAICELLLEHAWPAYATEFIADTLAAVRDGDTTPVPSFALALSAHAAGPGGQPEHAACGRAMQAAVSAKHAVFASFQGQQAITASHALVFAERALPSQRDRLHTIVMMLT